jgi:hypothetical protein
MASGYAVVNDRAEINIRTVGETERSAKISGILVIGQIMPAISWTDEQINGAWERIAKSTSSKVERVDITFAD